MKVSLGKFSRSLISTCVVFTSMHISQGVASETLEDKKAGKPVIAASSQAKSSTEKDPWENFNRSIFAFNDGADRYFLKPIAKAYVWATPSFVRRGVNNVFSNVLEVPSAINGILQGNIHTAAFDSGRFLVNTTIGLVGIFDVAQYMGLKTSNIYREDFGQTLAVWGVKSGPYVVLPFLGPSTLRDSASKPVDWYTDPLTYVNDTASKNQLKVTSLINTRANLLPLEKSLSGDKYTFIRDVYLQNRTYLINNGKVEDSFGADEELDEDSGY